LAGEQLTRYNELDHRHGFWRDRLARHLEEVADKLEGSSTVNCLTEMTATAAEAKAHLPMLGETLGEIVTSLQAVLTNSGNMVITPDEQPMRGLVRHRDWREAGRAAIRAALAIAIAG
jgi:uncharacterized membrane protein YccC